MDLKSARDDRKITQEVVAAEAGVGISSLKKMSGRSNYNASLNVIDALCEYFECQPGDLVEYMKKPVKTKKRKKIQK